MRTLLMHFLDSDYVPIVGIAVRAGGHLEFHFVVSLIRLRFANVPLHPRTPEYRPGHSIGDGIFGAQDTTPLVLSIQMRFLVSNCSYSSILGGK